MAESPLLAGACQDTVAEASPAWAVTPVGAPGTVAAAADGSARTVSSRAVASAAAHRIVVVMAAETTEMSVWFPTRARHLGPR
jgi:hypothetical protein